LTQANTPTHLKAFSELLTDPTLPQEAQSNSDTQHYIHIHHTHTLYTTFTYTTLTHNPLHTLNDT